MAENNVIYTIVTPDVPKAIPGEQLYVYVPQASFTNPGIAKFNKDEFTISADGLVSLVGKFIREEELNKEQFTVSETGAVSIKDEYIREQALTDISDALAKKLDKVTKETEFDEAYVKDASGTFQITLPISQGAQANTIVRRKSTGAINVGNAQASYEAAALGQVKDLVSSEASKRKQADNALQESINKKVDASAIVQETGTAEDKVMSQKAVTDALDGKVDKLSKGDLWRVYAVDGASPLPQPNYIEVSSNPRGQTVPNRDTSGRMKAENAANEKDVVNLGQLTTLLLNYLLKTGGVITGDLSIQGDLNVKGTTVTEDTETLNVKDAIVVTNSEGADISATLAGFVIRLNATDCYGIMYDKSSDSVKLGLGKITDGKFTFNEGEGNAVAVRADGSLMTNGHLVKWDATALKFVDAGKSVDDIKSDTLAALTPGDNISITKASDSEKVTISATGLVKKSTSANVVYINDANVALNTKAFTGYPSANTIPVYDAAGQLQTNNPIDPLDAVNKQYFEANTAVLIDNSLLGG